MADTMITRRMRRYTTKSRRVFKDAMRIYHEATEAARATVPQSAVSIECWECGGCVLGMQLAQSRREFNADICSTCAPWVRGVFSTERQS
jgi:hypothetical protein